MTKLNELTPAQAFALMYRRTAQALVMSGAALALSVVSLSDRFMSSASAAAPAARPVWMLVYSGGTSWSWPMLRFDTREHCESFLERSRPSIYVGECLAAPGLLPAAPSAPGKRKPSTPQPAPALPQCGPNICRAAP